MPSSDSTPASNMKVRKSTTKRYYGNHNADIVLILQVPGKWQKLIDSELSCNSYCI